jgi:hypothetical protein
MAADPRVFLERWHALVATRDAVALAGVLAENATMGAPPYWQKLEGRELVRHLLGLVLETIEDFTYHREWVDGSELALEFTGHVGDVELQGIDLISLDAAGRLRNIDVLIRPENALVALRERIRPRMLAYLASRAGAERAAR